MRRADIPEAAFAEASVAIRDTIGVTVAGAREPSFVKLRSAIGRSIAPGPALLAGTSEKIDTLSAGLLNGTASHALDFDDCSNTMGGHPSAPIVPAIIALAEEADVDGETFIRAYLAGFEFETRLGRAVNFVHYDKGWHPTATLGTFGAAAASAAMLGLDVRSTAGALAIAASMAAGIKANFGTDVKPFHVGQAVRNGMLAAYMAREGVDASPVALEHPQGFFEVFNGADNYKAEMLLQGWADPSTSLKSAWPTSSIRVAPAPIPPWMLRLSCATSTTCTRIKSALSEHSRIRVASAIPTGRIPNQVWMRNSACNMWWLVHSWRAL